MQNFDHVKYLSASTGTGSLSITLASGYFPVDESVVFPYFIINESTPTEYEIGQGSRSGTTLVRSVIIKSSNSNAAVNFTTGSKSIVCSLTAHVSPSIHYDATNFPYGPPSTDTGGIAMGPGSVADGASVAIGQLAVSYTDSTAFGSGAAATGSSSATGRSSSANTDAVAVGFTSVASRGAVSAGKNSAANYNGIALGNGANANRPASSTTDSGIVIGKSAYFSNVNYYAPSIVIGHETQGREDSITLGNKVVTNWGKTFTTGFSDDVAATSQQLQHVVTSLTGVTTNATTTSLGTVLDMFNAPTGGCLFQVDVVGMDESSNLVCVRIVGAVRYGGIVGTPTVTVVGRSSAFSTATASVSYTSSSLGVSVTGMAGITIRWGATITATWMAPRF